jgi:hypothetical protein
MSSGRSHGQLRQSQLITTFGPGSLLDLPKYSVLVGGLDHWLNKGEELPEPRLIDKLKRLLDVQNLKLYSPPPDNQDPTSPATGITVWQFPEWFVTQDVQASDKERNVRSRYLVHRSLLIKGKFNDPDRRRRAVVPVRFVRACKNGHIGDIDWYAFIHGGNTDCRRQLWMDERGTSGDLSEIWVRCECEKARRMIDAGKIQTRALGNCDGSRPWLGPYTKEACGEPNRMLIRTASNAYFPQIMSVISLPDRQEELAKAVNQVWDNFLQYVDTIEDLARERRRTLVQVALETFSDEEVFQEIQTRKSGVTQPSPKSVKEVELETLLSSKEEIGEDKPDGEFYARAIPRALWDKAWMTSVDRVVLAHRLREVIAQVGFTRFEASVPDIEGELDIGVRSASLGREISWLPAVENRGEGTFLSFKKSAIDAWLSKPAVKEHGKQLLRGFISWLDEHQGSQRNFPGLPYIMLHSLSHLLITAVSLECGYPSSSIRERIYAANNGYGILLFTGSPDAEGTLGGLVEAARQVDRHVRAALDYGKLCSNDPVCAQHDPENQNERRFLLGAACHGCLLIAETSCEQRNDFLDRALVVPTVDNLAAQFFQFDES